MRCKRRSPRGQVPAQVLGIVFLAAGLLAEPAAAVELHHLDIRTGKGSYQVDMAFSVAAQPALVIALLTDYGFPDRLNADVTAREVLGENDGLTRVRTEFRGCALFMCEDVTLVQDVAVSAGTITADVVPGSGDFSAGRLEWQIDRDGTGGSRIEFRANMEYEFFVMPVFGRVLLRNRLRQQLMKTAENLEAAASRRID